MPRLRGPATERTGSLLRELPSTAVRRPGRPGPRIRRGNTRCSALRAAGSRARRQGRSGTGRKEPRASDGRAQLERQRGPAHTRPPRRAAPHATQTAGGGDRAQPRVPQPSPARKGDPTPALVDRAGRAGASRGRFSLTRTARPIRVAGIGAGWPAEGASGSQRGTETTDSSSNVKFAISASSSQGGCGPAGGPQTPPKRRHLLKTSGKVLVSASWLAERRKASKRVCPATNVTSTPPLVRTPVNL
jgi:hypothetical protein